MASAPALVMATANKSPLYLPPEWWISQLLVLDLGSIVCTLLGPSGLGGHFICLHVAVEVVVLFFSLSTMVVLQAAKDVDRRSPAHGDWGGVPLTIFVATTKL